MTTTPSLVILAAGIGSRYGGLKQLDPIGPHGEIVIDYSIYDALQAGFEKLVFVIRRDIENDFRSAIGRKFENRADVRYVFQDLDDLPEGFTVPAERTKPWGTGHAVLAARNAIHEPFAIINADDFYGRRAYQLLADHLMHNTDATTYALAGFALRNTLSDFGSVARGICTVNADRNLQGIEEMTAIEKDAETAINHAPDGTTTRLSGDEWTSMNMWGFTETLMPHLESGFEAFLRENADNPKAEFFLPAVVDALINANACRVRVLPSPDTWFGVTYQDDKPHVSRGIHDLVAKGIYPAPLWN